MAIPIPSIEPTEFYVGDTVKWTKSFGDYPASDGWSLNYYFRGKKDSASLPGDEEFDVAATTDGDTFEITIANAVTSLLAPGTFHWEALVDLSGEFKVVDSGRVIVKPCLQLVQGGYDGRSWARKALASIRAVLENRATRDELSYTLPGVGMTIGKLTPEQLWFHHDRLKAVVDAEDEAEAIDNGEGTGNNIYARFSRVT